MGRIKLGRSVQHSFLYCKNSFAPWRERESEREREGGSEREGQREIGRVREEESARARERALPDEALPGITHWTRRNHHRAKRAQLNNDVRSFDI